MTAIVGILNKRAIAIATDSAVTFGGTHKVLNSANKIFTLSKYHPVAVMTYNNATFMNVPWEIIIKEFRKKLGVRSQEHLIEYVDIFLEFLRKENFFCDEKTKHEKLKNLLYSFYLNCKREICLEYKIGENDFRSISKHIDKKLSSVIEYNKKVEKCDEFKDYKYDRFIEYSKADITIILNAIAEKEIKINKVLFLNAFFAYIVARNIDIAHSGLVFVGYGDDDIYPSLIPLNISVAFDNHLKFYIEKESKISERGSQAVICPFAQTDVMQTIMEGINPRLKKDINNVVINSIESFINRITMILNERNVDSSVVSLIKEMDTEDWAKIAAYNFNKRMIETYTAPLLKTIAHLDKQDMANMAESFISLTSLVRRMQPNEETVGGPIDVAVISKGDGFVWINRKHYFKPEFNYQFFKNYFYNREASNEE